MSDAADTVRKYNEQKVRVENFILLKVKGVN